MKNSKNSLIAAAIVAACAVSAPALAAPSKSAASSAQYLGAQLAIADVSGAFDSGIAFVGTFGMPLPQVNPNVAFEAELTKSIANPEYNWGGSTLELDYYTLGGYGVYNIPASEQINFRVRVGLAYEHITVDYPTWTGTSSVSDSEIGLSVGAGITVKLQSNMNFIAEYTNLDSDIDHLSAGLQFKF